jgi:hypothetical protein
MRRLMTRKGPQIFNPITAVSGGVEEEDIDALLISDRFVHGRRVLLSFMRADTMEW